MPPTITIPKPPQPGLGKRLLGSPLVEALTTPHPVDRYLELVRPAFSLHEVRAEITGVRHSTPDSATLTLRANSNWRGFRAGQFVRFAVEIDGVRHTRCYSLACSERTSRRELEVTVKAHPEGVVSGFLNGRAQPGTVVGLSVADGDFHLPEERPDRLLLIGGGSGITPLISMLRTLCEEGHDRPVTLLHYSPTPAAAIYRAELAELAVEHPNVRVVHAHTKERAGAELHGHFSERHLDAAEPAYADAETFVCGPPALVDAVREHWAADGIERHLHVEHFVPPAPAVALGEAEGTISFTRSDLQVDNSGASLLEQAEGAGLEPEFGCRMGICHSCVCRKVAGSVRDTRNGELSGAPEQEIQLCVSVPVGDVELEL